MKRHLTLFMSIILIVCLTACGDSIPKEYKDGVPVDNGFPEEITIPDDAVVFAFEGDGGDFDLSFGAEDSLEDITDYYNELFLGNGKIAVTTTEKGGGTVFKGIFDDCKFSVAVRQPEDETEKKVFTTVVEINTYQISPQERIMGFWVYSGYQGKLDAKYKLEGSAWDIGKETIDYYGEYELTENTGLAYYFTGESSIERNLNDKVYPADVEFDVVDGKEIMTIRGVTVPTFVRSSYEEMMAGRYDPPYCVFGDFINYYVTEITSTSITVGWEGSNNVKQFLFSIEGNGIDFEGGSLTNQSGTYTFNDLTPGDEYTVCVSLSQGGLVLPGTPQDITLPLS